MPRKKPFSGKKKKEQLQTKREQKKEEAVNEDLLPAEKRKQIKEKKQAHRTNAGAPHSGRPNGGGRSNRLRTVFHQDTEQELEKRKQIAKKPYTRDPSKPLPTLYKVLIDIPKRPHWDYSMTKKQVEDNEKRMFDKYLQDIKDTYPVERMNYFEQNLEVWRQLWRSCEIGDVICILADIRFPTFHFPPALYHYVVDDLKKPLIAVLTKADLVPERNVKLWTQWFLESFPGVKVCPVASYEKKSEEEMLKVTIGKKKKKKLGKLHYWPAGMVGFLRTVAACGVRKGGEVVQVDYCPPHVRKNDFLSQFSIAVNISNASPSDVAAGERTASLLVGPGGEVSPVSRESVGNKETEEEAEGEEEEAEEDEEEEESEAGEISNEQDLEDDHYAPVKEVDYITITTIGNPNVGKSTFVNALKGSKVCSTSRTPGHTKWKQTIFLDKHLMLCDCPGVVFPAVDMPKQLQVLCGIFPIAQVREPYSAIQMLCERVAVEKIYDLKPVNLSGQLLPAEEYKNFKWSAFAICEAYAAKRGYRTKKGNVDPHRAGLEILFDVIDGRVLLAMLPNQQIENLAIFTHTMAENFQLQREDRLALFGSDSVAQSPSATSAAVARKEDEGGETTSEGEEEEEEEEEQDEGESDEEDTAGASNPFAALM